VNSNSGEVGWVGRVPYAYADNKVLGDDRYRPHMNMGDALSDLPSNPSPGRAGTRVDEATGRRKSALHAVLASSPAMAGVGRAALGLQACTTPPMPQVPNNPHVPLLTLRHDTHARIVVT
jgi:hypothetical protein